VLIQNYIVSRKTEDVIPYSEFKESLRTDKIKEITITQESISGERETEKGSRRFQTVRVEDPDLVKELETYHVKYTGKIDSKWLTNILSWIIPLVFFFFIWRILFSRIGPETSVMSFGKSRAKIFAEKDKKVTFADVAGIDEAKVRQQLLDEYNLEIGGGLGQLKGKIWRIGLMGHSCTETNVFLLLHALERVLSREGFKIARGSGVKAANDALRDEG
jgi:cell division protease FtsH